MTNESSDLVAGHAPPPPEMSANAPQGDAVDWVNTAFLTRWPCVGPQMAGGLFDIVHPDDRSRVSAALKAVHNGEARSVTCSVRLGREDSYADSRIRLTRDSDQDPRGVVMHVEEAVSSVAAGDDSVTVARRMRAIARDRSYQELRRGAVTAYVRVLQSQEDAAVELLTDNHYICCRDNGDPDCPPGHIDLYVERHYGMTNPDAAIRDLHHTQIAQLLEAAGIGTEDRGGSVVHGMAIPTDELHQVVDATNGRELGYTVRAVDPAEIDEKLTLVARTLNISREALTTQSVGR